AGGDWSDVPGVGPGDVSATPAGNVEPATGEPPPAEPPGGTPPGEAGDAAPEGAVGGAVLVGTEGLSDGLAEAFTDGTTDGVTDEVRRASVGWVHRSLTAADASSGDAGFRGPDSGDRPAVPRQRCVWSCFDALHECDHEPLVQLRSGRVLQSMKRFLHGECLAVGPRRGHGRESVGHGEDPGDERNVLPGQSVQVALAVPALVVMADAAPTEIQVREVADDRVAKGHVLLDDRVFLGRQRGRLAQDLVG